MIRNVVKLGAEVRKLSHVKTNAMRILDQQNVDYEMLSYDSSDGRIDGISVAEKIGRDPEGVYKTLVAQGNSRRLYVFIIPVKEELDLKKAARVTGEKKIEMIAVKDILVLTGYQRGGCSPVGMKKSYPTYVDESVVLLEKIVCSGGRIGAQMELAVDGLVKVTCAVIDDLIK